MNYFSSLDPKDYVLIIGSSNMDLNIYVKRLPKLGETVTGGTFKQFLGGKGANQAVASVRSGSKTYFIAKIGIDTFGDQMVSQLKKEGVNIDNIIRDSQQASGVAFIMIDENGENIISVAPGANVNLNVEDIQKNADLIKRANSLVVQMEIPMNTIQEIYKIASEGNLIKILNPAPLKPIPTNILKNIDIIIPNEGELYQLHSLLGFEEPSSNGLEKIKQVSEDITRTGVRIVITTLGVKGAIIYQSTEDLLTLLPAYKVQAVDTVGAGDCFNGVLASKLNQGKNLIEAVKYAISAASIAVTRKGAQESMPFIDEIEERYKKYNKLLN
ncbi:MAG: ribokinase [Candidatus Heimdallarchaeota archaeon]